MAASRPQWIEIVHWDKFQHYSNRSPVWIKNYTALLDDPAYLALTDAQRGLLHGLWLLYAKTHREIPLNTLRISRALSNRTLSLQLEALNHAGFIKFRASKPLAKRYPQRQRQSSALTSTTEADSPAPPALPISQPPKSEEHPLTQRLLAEIRDADTRTEMVLRRFENKLAEGAFARALESLKERRRDNGRPLVSEARYVTAALAAMQREGQFAR